MNTRTLTVKALAAVSLCLIAILTLSLTEARAQNASPAVVQVEPKYVCMITDQVYSKEQIPVTVADKTYYGCCQMCESKLKSDPESRTAVDPVSGAKVDKATAIIGATPEGGIVYFESVENLTVYANGTKSGS